MMSEQELYDKSSNRTVGNVKLDPVLVCHDPSYSIEGDRAKAVDTIYYQRVTMIPLGLK